MPKSISHVVNYSGGACSWCAAERVVEQHGPENVTLLFADTLIEDPDLYRFLDEGAEALGCKLVKIADGRTPWQVFMDVKFLGNSRVDPCSLHLKRKLLDKWMEDNLDPEYTVQYFGIDWSEQHRFVNLQARKVGWNIRAPMCESPFLTKDQQIDRLRLRGIKPPRLYGLGFPHNNCGGACVKAGQAHFRHLYHTLPNVYDEWERNEEWVRFFIGREDVAILRSRKGGVSTPITLREFREEIERQSPSALPIMEEEWGGCGCAVE